MTSTLPLVSTAYAAALGLLAVVLTLRVIVHRVKLCIDAGGGNAVMAQAIRADANLAEQVPLALLLLAGAEIGGTPPALIHALGATLVLSRLASAWGPSRSLSPTTSPRQAGAGLTALVTVVASLLILWRLAAGH